MAAQILGDGDLGHLQEAHPLTEPDDVACFVEWVESKTRRLELADFVAEQAASWAEADDGAWNFDPSISEEELAEREQIDREDRHPAEGELWADIHA